MLELKQAKTGRYGAVSWACRRWRLTAVLLSVLLLGPATASAEAIRALIDTSRGEISVELNERAAPTSVASFVNLARRGFYDGLTFHRVEPGFVAQGGDPAGNGSGGPGYRFRGEIVLPHTRPGILSMANSGPGTDGSQFFITLAPAPHLNGKHSVFGQVSQGLPVVFSLRPGDRINTIRISGDTEALMANKERQLKRWNAILDREFPDLRAAE